MDYLMLKDTPVMEIDGFTCRVLDYDRLPIALRYPDVNFDDVMHGWTESRVLNIGRSNAKKILAACRLPQTNMYAVASAFYFVSLTDCYWIKREGENLSWTDVNLFQNEFNEVVLGAALFGAQGRVAMDEKVRTPETAVQGMSAKAWVRNGDAIWLYKVGKKEEAASKILSQLDLRHVPYSLCTSEELKQHASADRLLTIYEAGEAVVKCKCITNEDTSIITWEDFAIYCDRNGMDPYNEFVENYPEEFYEMQVADYILGNEDRHTANYGFFVNNDTGEILGPHPLMDHDHAFVNEEIHSQTQREDKTLEEAAKDALQHIHIDFEPLAYMRPPKTISEEQWNGVLERAGVCMDYQYQLQADTPSGP